MMNFRVLIALASFASLFVGPELVAAKMSKVTFLTRLKALPFFQAGKPLQAANRVEILFQRLPGTKMCFVAGTPVWTADGVKRIEDVMAGDRVLARDERTGRQEYKMVLEAVVTHPAALVHVRYSALGRHSGDEGADGEEELVCTPQHPFFVGASGAGRFVPAGELREGDVLCLADGRSAVITAIRGEEAPRGEAWTTYNFEVEDFHTYFVGGSGVWVHYHSDWCHDLFSAFNSRQTSEGGLWEGYQHVLLHPPKKFQTEFIQRWNLRLLNEARHRHFAGEASNLAPFWHNSIGQDFSPKIVNGVLRPDAEKLRNNIRIAMKIDDPGTDFTPHHIVPTYTSDYTPNMKEASDRARAVLTKHDIKINEAANGVFLPNRKALNVDYDPSVYGQIHNGGHSLEYLKYVADRLQAADRRGFSANEIRDELQMIADELVHLELTL